MLTVLINNSYQIEEGVFAMQPHRPSHVHLMIFLNPHLPAKQDKRHLLQCLQPDLHTPPPIR
jgi:hypothetical protein